MKPRNLVVPIAALAVALGSFSAEAAQRDRGERRDRGSRSEGQQRSRGGDDSARQRGDSGSRSQSSSDRGAQRAERRSRESQPQDQNRATASAEPQQPQRDNQATARRDSSARDGQRASRNDSGSRGDSRSSSSYSRDRSDSNRGRYDNNRNDNNRGRYDNNRSYNRGGYDRGNSYNRGNYSRSYYAPRVIQRRSNYRRYYGSGGHLSLYFNIGSGYRYGSPYSGRVYGYRRNIVSYGNYVSYGDVRLKISPRDAQVYVDGYYAGVVDDFDGFFQRLTLEVGPHEIEVVAGGQSQFYDVYVDPNNTVDLHGDLFGEQYDDRDR